MGALTSSSVELGSKGRLVHVAVVIETPGIFYRRQLTVFTVVEVVNA
jgi:hypothetical protein